MVHAKTEEEKKRKEREKKKVYIYIYIAESLTSYLPVKINAKSETTLFLF
jgi:hypothetical protein